MKVCKKNSNCLNWGEVGEEGFREEIFVNQFSSLKELIPTHVLNLISILISQGIMLPGVTIHFKDKRYNLTSGQSQSG